jgi:hypothetical protein
VLHSQTHYTLLLLLLTTPLHAAMQAEAAPFIDRLGLKEDSPPL